MAVTRAVAVVEDPRYREHRGPQGHPERPERLVAVGEAIDARRQGLRALASRPAEDEEIARVHERAYLEGLQRAAARAPLQLDADTYLGRESLAIARLAAGATVELARAVARGEAASGLAAVRPPGHHAEPDRAMGFCLFNNVAIAARALQAEEGVERVAIVDWDVHHGNGTQHRFEADPSVLYVSTHQHPFYPGTGDASETGAGEGEGATLNVPLPARAGDAEYVGAFQRLVAPALRAFRPEVILVSAGFDAHRDDPLAQMQLGSEGYRGLAAILRVLAEDLCEGRLVFVLEGGYALSGLREGVGAVLDVALAAEAPPWPADVEAPAGSDLARVVERVARYHGGRIPDLGAA